MTIKEWLTTSEEALQNLGIASARIDTELILATALEKDRTFLISHREDELHDEIRTKADAFLKRRLNHEPIAFILGHKEFYGLTFKTDKRALIPRGETEPIVEAALAWLKEQDKPCVVADIGTGAGTIVVTLAHTAPKHTFLATEVDAEALALAKENATTHNVSISFYQGSFGEPLLANYTGKIDLLVTNLPYIPTGLLVNLDPTVQYFEPNVALEGGATGLELYEQFMPQAKELLAPGGLLLCEHDYDQGEAMRDLAYRHFPEGIITTIQDGLHHDRVLSCQT